MPIPALTPADTGSTFVLMSRLDGPNTGGSAHQSISFNGLSSDAYGAFVAPYDMYLKNFSYRCTTTVTTISFYCRVNGGSAQLLYTYSGAAKTIIISDLDIAISSGDSVELTFVSGNNSGDDIQVSYSFEAQSGKSDNSFFLTLQRENLDGTDRELLYAETSTTGNAFPVSAEKFTVKSVHYFCKSGAAVADHTIKLSLDGSTTTIGTLAAGQVSVSITGLSYFVGRGQYFGAVVNATAGNGDDGVIFIECQNIEISPFEYEICSGTNGFTGGTKLLKGSIFKCHRNRVLTDVELGFYVGGFGATFKVYEVDSSDNVVSLVYSESLGTSPSAIATVTLAAPVDLEAGKYYAICLTRDSAGTFNFRADTTPNLNDTSGYFTWVKAAENASNSPAVSASLTPAVSYSYWINPITTTPGDIVELTNNKSLVCVASSDLETPQTILKITAPVAGFIDFVSFSADADNSGSIYLEINGGGAVEVLSYSITADDTAYNALDYLEFALGDVIELTHGGTGSAGVGGVATIGFFMGTPPEPVIPPEPPVVPPVFNSGTWPAELPNGAVNGAAGGVASNKTVFEPELGPTIDRRRGSFVTRTVSIELPPLTQTQYEIFLDFLNANRVSEFTFPDPMTKGNKQFKFRKGKEPFQETRLNINYIKITFDLIRVD